MQLSDLLLKVQRRLGTSVTTDFDDDIKKEALNTARKRIIKKYDIDRFIKEEDVTFTDGGGTYPSDYLRYVTKNEGENGLCVSGNWYTKVSFNAFDDFYGNCWTDSGGSIKARNMTNYVLYEDDHIVYDGRNILFTEEGASVTMRYIMSPDDMVSDTDDSLFPEIFDEAHIFEACFILLYDNRRYDEAQAMKNEANKFLKIAIGENNIEEGKKIERNSAYSNCTVKI